MLVPGTLFCKRPCEGCASVYVLVEVVGTRLYEHRLIVPVNNVWTCVELGTACKTAFDFPVAKTREKNDFKNVFPPCLRGHVLCAVLWESLLESQRRRRCVCGVLMGPFRNSPGCSDMSQVATRTSVLLQPICDTFIDIALAPVAACPNVL